MSSNNYDLSRLCRDAFVLLSGATRIDYRDGSCWQTEDDEREHPLLPPLRAASLASLISDPPSPSTLLDGERNANDAMRRFISRLEEVCARHGGPTGSGDQLLAWIDENLK
jgi:hypothetical protein